MFRIIVPDKQLKQQEMITEETIQEAIEKAGMPISRFYIHEDEDCKNRYFVNGYRIRTQEDLDKALSAYKVRISKKSSS